MQVPVVQDSDVSFDELSEAEQRAAIEVGVCFCFLFVSEKKFFLKAEISSATADLDGVDVADLDYDHIDEEMTSKLRSGIEEGAIDLN